MNHATRPVSGVKRHSSLITLIDEEQGLPAAGLAMQRQQTPLCRRAMQWVSPLGPSTGLSCPCSPANPATV